MARRSREQVLEEFHHLYDCLNAAIEAAQPISDFWDIDPSEVVTRNSMLANVKSGQTTASGLVSGTRAALADFRLGLKDLRRQRPTDAERFDSHYIALRGKLFLADIDAARSDK